MSELFSDPEMQEIFEGFLVETQELLEGLSTDLMTLENEPEDMDLLNRIFRGFHTIKGTSSFMGFEEIAGITHHAEDLLNKLRRSELTVNQSIIDVLLEVQDWIEHLVENLKNGEEEEVDFTATIAAIEKLKSGGELPPPEAQSEPEPQEDQPEPEPQDKPEEATADGQTQTDEQKARAVDEVIGNQELVSKPGDFDEDELALIDQAFAEVNQDFWDEQGGVKKEILDSYDNKDASKEQGLPQPKNEAQEEPKEETPEEQPKPQAPPKDISEPKPVEIPGKKPPKTSKTKPKVTSETIRIDVGRVESLMDLSGELVLGRNRLTQLTEILDEELKNRDYMRNLRETSEQIDLITSDIQSAVMRMRMVPVGKLYQKAPRIVRDLSRENGKKINLVVKGEETEIDRGIIEELNDPLVHMIRNSCDHGIELPDVRKKKGKPEKGTVTLDAEQEGNNIVLKISDDGAGMDPDKLKKKAMEKGILSEDQAAQMTDHEAYQLIFAPGFSTAAKVTSVSGRGVGMDVVRTNIQNLKGMIEIESELGVGSTFIIKLPLTLAIIQGLLVRVKKETFAIPLSSVIEVVAIDSKSVYTINQQEVIRIRQEVLPITRLDRALHFDIVEESLDKKNVVNVGFGVQRIGLVVDELLGQQEIVIKSLGEYLGSISGIAGSTILGDGRVIMIIDVAELVQDIYKGEFKNFLS